MRRILHPMRGSNGHKLLCGKSCMLPIYGTKFLTQFLTHSSILRRSKSTSRPPSQTHPRTALSFENPELAQFALKGRLIRAVPQARRVAINAYDYHVHSVVIVVISIISHNLNQYNPPCIYDRPLSPTTPRSAVQRASSSTHLSSSTPRYLIHLICDTIGGIDISALELIISENISSWRHSLRTSLLRRSAWNSCRPLFSLILERGNCQGFLAYQSAGDAGSVLASPQLVNSLRVQNHTFSFAGDP